MPYITMHETLVRINKNCVNLLRGPFWPIRINFHAHTKVALREILPQWDFIFKAMISVVIEGG